MRTCAEELATPGTELTHEDPFLETAQPTRSRVPSLHPRPCLLQDQAAPGVYLELDVHGKGVLTVCMKKSCGLGPSTPVMRNFTSRARDVVASGEPFEGCAIVEPPRALGRGQLHESVAAICFLRSRMIRHHSTPWCTGFVPSRRFSTSARASASLPRPTLTSLRLVEVDQPARLGLRQSLVVP
jgi:hypothetical protein